jgi:mRNA-degrading endonuclease RelE of RelBE toxin-antitoxin system
VTLLYSREAKERIRILPPETKKGIKQFLEALREDPYLGKPLQRELAGFWSVAFKNYRIIYRLAESRNILQIYTVGRRKEIYQELAERKTF